jgi:hypothetical protein
MKLLLDANLSWRLCSVLGVIDGWQTRLREYVEKGGASGAM